MGGNKKKGVGNGSKQEWVGKHKVLVRTQWQLLRSEYFVVDLKKGTKQIEMKHPYKLYSDGFLGSAAVVLGDTIAVYEMGGHYKDKFKAVTEHAASDDHIHSFLGTSKSILNLKTNPPKWSKWEDCGAETASYWLFPRCDTLGNKIFSFGFSKPVGQVYDTTNKIPRWEDITMPLGLFPGADYDYNIDWPPATSDAVMSDPKNNRLILHFPDVHCLYAYYPDKEEESQWECLDSNMETFPGSTAQVLDDVIYFFESSHTIHAYDIPQRKWLDVFWPRKSPWDCERFFTEMAQMIHLGYGMMCLAISYPYPIPPHGSLLFFRFRVERVADEAVRVTPVSFHSYNLDPGCKAYSFAPF